MTIIYHLWFDSDISDNIKSSHQMISFKLLAFFITHKKSDKIAAFSRKPKIKKMFFTSNFVDLKSILLSFHPTSDTS